MMILQVTANAGSPASFKIWDSATVDTADGTTRFDTEGVTLVNFMNGVGQKFTVGPIKISNNQYCTIESITNATLKISDSSINAWVVERG